MPYSVSIPQTFGRDMGEPYPSSGTTSRRETGDERRPREIHGPSRAGGLQVLTRGDTLDRPSTSGALVAVVGEERADEDDALALLARDLRPVVGVRRVGQVLVLLV